MIIKGKSRAGPSQLAHHLGRADTNERVEILQLDSAGTPAEAFRDWQTYTLATNGRLGLYHANIDPDARYTMTEEQWTRAVDVLEEELGLQGQPRAVVMHEKHGRQHIHVVWQRTDIDTMTLRSDSRNYQAHERASYRLEEEFGHEHVPGKHAKRDREAQPEMPSSEISHAEWQQAERRGVDPRQRKEEITALYGQADSGRAFVAALEEAGYIVARGDRRDFVLIDSAGDVLSLRRQVAGITAKDLREFIADLAMAELPGVEQARKLHQEQGRGEASPEPEQAPKKEPTREAAEPDRRAEDQARLDGLRERIDAAHRAALAEQEARHNREIGELQDRQFAAGNKAFDTFAREQAARAVKERPPEPGGIERLFRSIREALSEEARVQRLAAEAQREADARDRREDEARIFVSGIMAGHRQEMDQLVSRQARERANLLREQRDDAKRRVRDEERAIALQREYERRDRAARDREGPERDDRAR